MRASGRAEARGARRDLYLGAGAALLVLAVGVESGLVRGAALLSLDATLADLRAPFALAALATLPTLLLAQLMLLDRGRAREEARAPAWLQAAVPLALVALALGQTRAPFGLGTPLAPLAALALANVANRRADPASAARSLALVAALSATTLLVLQLALRSWDRAPVERVRHALAQEAPLGLDELDPELRYIARFRFGRAPEELDRRGPR